MATLALCPSRERPVWARETLASFEATRRDRASRLVFIVDADDPTLKDYPNPHVVEPGGSMGAALWKASHDPKVLRDSTSVGMIGDDNRFRTPGWDLIIDGWLSQHVGVAYGDDGFQHERLPTSWWVSRPLVDVFGMAPVQLEHLYMDNWWKELGQGAGCLRYFPDVEIEHMHPLAGKAERDAIYDRGNNRARADHDRNWFHHWLRNGRPSDLRKARSIVDRDRPRRVLADWHHPALWESLSILFEDRFGWELYSPLGMDWTQHGWKFETLDTIGWSESDYLVFEDARLVDGHHERTEAEYPDRPRKMVTWDQAQGMRWDFVLCSVAVHQRPFYDLAQQFGARLINQVGNAKHRLERVPGIVLASSNLGRLGARYKAVTYHQEFDRAMFAQAPPSDPLAVSSFMLRLDWTSCEYKWLSESSGVRWKTAGGQDPYARTYLAPMSKVADLMRESGWIWHDKRIGDGYGHVIHNAASMGRPLIGHASHYKGLMGEPLWKNLETCIDLDTVSQSTALRLIRGIANDPDWYREISESTAANFARLVDFDAEVEEIRLALA